MTILNIFYKLYKIRNHRLRKFIRNFIVRKEGGEFYSTTLRKIFKEYHQIEIGLYSHGGCFIPFQVDKNTKIGRYCSIAQTARVMNRNHPLEFKSTHAFFFNPIFKFCKENVNPHIPLEIGNDVWIGHNALIMPHVRKIDDGAVIAAGAVVNKDIPPYAVVVGNPARVVRYRFSQEKIDELLKSKWWEKTIEEIEIEINDFLKPFELQKDSSTNEKNLEQM